MNRREFIEMAGGAGLFCASGCMSPVKPRVGCYSVAVLGDTHYDAESESVYHSHYDESNKWAKVQHEEFRRNGGMWRERCPRLLEASAGLARGADTAFVLQLGRFRGDMRWFFPATSTRPTSTATKTRSADFRNSPSTSSGI